MLRAPSSSPPTGPTLPSASTPARLISAATLALALLAPATAPAQGAKAKEQKELAAARQAFREGEDAEARGDLTGALARFQAALAVKETPQLHVRIGVVQEKLGKLLDALASYERAREKAATLPAVAKVAKEQLEALRPRIPTLTVTVSTPPPGLAVTLDGAPLAVGAAVPLNPGAHRLRAEAPGFAPREQELAAAERGVLQVNLDLRPTAPTPPADGGPSKVPGGVLAGVGVASLVAGGVLVGLSVSKDAAIDVACGSPERDACPVSRRDEILADVSKVNALRFSGIAVGVVGAAGVVTGAVLLARASRSGAGSEAERPVTLLPLLGPGMAGVAVSGRF